MRRELFKNLANNVMKKKDSSINVLKNLNSANLKKQSGKAIEDLKNTFSGKNIRDAAYNKELTQNLKKWGMSEKEFNKYDKLADSNLLKQRIKTGVAYAGAGGLTAGAGAAAVKAIKDRKRAKDIEEKAAEAYEYSIRKIAACEEMYADAMLDQEVCIEVLAEVGLYDKNGINKEAAEESAEAAEFFGAVSMAYDESLLKIAAAEDCYAEAVETLNEATDILADFGYEFY